MVHQPEGTESAGIRWTKKWQERETGRNRDGPVQRSGWEVGRGRAGQALGQGSVQPSSRTPGKLVVHSLNKYPSGTACGPGAVLTARGVAVSRSSKFPGLAELAFSCVFHALLLTRTLQNIERAKQ